MVPSDNNTRWRLLKQDYSPSKNRMLEIHSFHYYLIFKTAAMSSVTLSKGKKKKGKGDPQIKKKNPWFFLKYFNI